MTKAFRAPGWNQTSIHCIRSRCLNTRSPESRRVDFSIYNLLVTAPFSDKLLLPKYSSAAEWRLWRNDV